MIEIGIAAWSLGAAGPEVLQHIAQLGLACAQVDLGPPGDPDCLDQATAVEVWRRVAAASGVTIVGVGARALNDIGMTALPGSAAAHRSEQVTAAAVDAAIGLRARLVFFPSFRAGEIRGEADLRRTARVLKQACQRASGHPLVVASENSLDGADNTPLVAADDEPNFRIVLDSYNPVRFGHQPRELIGAVGERVARQVHVKDGTRSAAGVAIGNGDGDVVATVATVVAQRIADYLILENDYRREAPARVARDRAVIAAVLQEGGRRDHTSAIGR